MNADTWEHLLEEIGLTPVLRYDINSIFGPSHGDIEQPAFFVHLAVLASEKHRYNQRFVSHAGKTVSSSLVVYGEYDVRLETFGGMYGHEPHVEVLATDIRDRLRIV